jgi:hypothetical protein
VKDITLSLADLAAGIVIRIDPSTQTVQYKPVKAIFDLQSAAKYVGMSPRKLSELCARRGITYSKISARIYRFTAADLDEYINSKKVPRRALL